MIYVSNVLKYKRRTDLENPRVETIWIEIKLKSYNVLKCCFYRSDFVSSQSLFITEMQSSIEEAFNYTPYVILTGDINIDFFNSLIHNFRGGWVVWRCPLSYVTGAPN